MPMNHAALALATLFVLAGFGGFGCTDIVGLDEAVFACDDDRDCAAGFNTARSRAATATAANCSGVVPNSCMCARAASA